MAYSVNLEAWVGLKIKRPSLKQPFWIVLIWDSRDLKPNDIGHPKSELVNLSRDYTS